MSDDELARLRARLLHPPLVAALGPANIGKSALLNALAGRSVSIVADEPGTTRDHVGVMLDLEGLVVRYVDTPGLRELSGEPGPGTEPAGKERAQLEHQARALALDVVRGADVVLLCGDAGAPPVDRSLVPGPRVLRVATRCDLDPPGGVPGWRADVRTSARTGEGLRELAVAVREILVPRAALEDPRAWRFWEV